MLPFMMGDNSTQKQINQFDRNLFTEKTLWGCKRVWISYGNYDLFALQVITDCTKKHNLRERSSIHQHVLPNFGPPSPVSARSA